MSRPDRVDVLFLLAAVGAAALILALGAGLTFFSDEWAMIETRSLTDPGTWFVPHNEHWYTVAVLAYRALVETVGLVSYIPYLAALVACHVVVAALVYRLVRGTSGPWPALAIGIVVLVFGSGFENLYWAFQIGFVGSLALGLGAVLAFDHVPLSGRRVGIGIALLTLAVATSGIGLIACVVVGVELLLDPRRRRAVPWLAVPALAYGAWYLSIGRAAIEAHEGLFRLGGIADLPPILATGFGAAVGAIVGVGSGPGRVVVVLVLVLAVGYVLWRRRIWISPRAVAAVSAVAVLYGLIAMARSYVGPEAADYTRYTYVSAILLAVGATAQIGRPTLHTTNARRAWLLVGGLVFALSLTWNVRLLIAGRTIFVDRAERTRALVTVALERPLPTTTDPDRSLVLVPSPSSLARIVDLYGSPVADWLARVPPIRDVVLADARRVLAEGAEIPLPDQPMESP